ncbi:EpsG family protein [Shouchella clausii]|uniref:EpsG family protein n=1 Tax=Shouchella clausii TaxID=79880 RepID=UPI000BA5FB6E|nr:EpsG family protein [Shouchella clausii]MBX0319604.1 EpsG family protein [Shouchella clausii]MDO7283909.1 EpsG family protein [Shouchella clausii]MDO7304005.1 EpsG family protein [Shouchella clausii]PAF09772.1 hypothetical protein CHH65_08955 [Shouchella clausii]
MSKLKERAHSAVSPVKKTLYLLIGLCISFFLALRPIPWARDDYNYLEYMINASILFSNALNKIIANPLNIFTVEPLWLSINYYLSFIASPEMSLRIIIFLGAFMVVVGLGRFTNYSFLILFFFIFMPQILKNHITHLRQGLALGVFLIGWTSKRKIGRKLKYLSPFIHTSFLFVFFFLFFEKMSKKVGLSLSVRLTLFCLGSFLAINYLPHIAGLLGDRRISEYEFSTFDDSSFLGWIWWALLGLIIIILTQRNRESILGYYAICFYLISYFFVDFSARIFENVLPIIVASIVLMRTNLKFLLIGILLLYSLIQWYIRGFNF